MTLWETRSTEVANLLNPAFCGELMLCCIKTYMETSKKDKFFLLNYFGIK